MMTCSRCGGVDMADYVCGECAALPPVRTEPLLALPEDVRLFIYNVTLHLQANRSKTPEQHAAMFRKAYWLYVKYDVEGLRANAAAHGGGGRSCHDWRREDAR